MINCDDDVVIRDMFRIICGDVDGIVDRRNTVARRAALLQVVERDRLFSRLVKAEGLGQDVVVKRALRAGRDRDEN